MWIQPGATNYVHTEFVDLAAVGFDVARYDPRTQLLSENHVRITPDGAQFTPIVLRLITPGEMDLMARIAASIWSSGSGRGAVSHFGSMSQAHLSVYGRTSR